MIVTLVCSLGAHATAADEERAATRQSLFDQKFIVAFGGFFPTIQSTLSYDGSDGTQGSEIDLSDDLGLDDFSASVWVGLGWRFLPRHQLQIEWFQLNQSGDATAVREFNFGDTTISVGAALSSKLDFNLGRITYGYALLSDEKYQLSLMAGAHIATAKATVTATGQLSVGGGPPFTGTQTESTSTYTFPLPHLGGEFSYEFAPRWALQLKLLAFALELSDYEGTLIEADGSVAYQLTEHFGLGAGIKYFNLNLRAKRSGGGAEFDYQFLGPAVFGYIPF